MTNGEGGRDPEESRIDYVIDRVNTTGTVWLGLTLGCCQCHSHKFDPISQKDYYSLSAFFDSIDEDGRAGDKATPYLKYKSSTAQLAVDEARQLVATRNETEAVARQQALAGFEPWLERQIVSVQRGFKPWNVVEAAALESAEGTVLQQNADGTIESLGPTPRQDDYRLFASAALSRVTGLRLEVFPSGNAEPKDSTGGSEFILTDVKLQIRNTRTSQLGDLEIASALADAEDGRSRKKGEGNYGLVKDTLDDDPRNGWTLKPKDRNDRHFAIFALAEPLVLGPDEQLVFTMLHRSTRGNANIRKFRVSLTDQPGDATRSLGSMPMEELAAAKVTRPSEIETSLRNRLERQFLADHAAYQEANADLDRAERQLKSAEQASGKLDVMVLKERAQPRQTYVLERGVWDNKGEEVHRSVPSAILPWPAERTQSRLDLARWLVSRDNPLTARVVVNQLWQMCFGAGLVRTPEDFGLQGEPPTNPELLDWLACELMDHEWDLKHVLRLIVTSRTYRQSSVASAELLELDPDNRLLARGARFRLPSWMIRDAALAASGLLNPALGGPPAMPYQPDGVWEEMFMGRFKYEPSQGPAQYRRALYAFWRRAVAPTFLFDSAQRRFCEVRPQRTNTPLQALTLLNDLTMQEAARELARGAIATESEAEARINLIFRRVLSRQPAASELSVLQRELNQALRHYRASPKEAATFLNFGQPENRRANSPVELASYTVVATMILNLDEAITHE
jgi:hypothetical protein